MAKRLGPNDKFGHAKKIKLDVSVNRGRISANTSIISEFWASDDDDDVLLATQQAEEKQRQTDRVRSRESEFAFNDFVAEDHGSTSTQEIFANDLHLPSSLNVEEIFGTDETFVFLPDARRGHNTVLAEVETGTASKWTGSSSNLATETRRQLAQERQLKFLMERVDVLKKENEKLQKDLSESNNQASAKDGEVGLLRNELRQARKLLQASKMDKLTMAAEGEKEYNEKVGKALKQIIAKDAELKITNVEFSKLKIRNATNNERNIFKENLEPTVTDADEYRSLLRMENLSIGSPFAKQSFPKTKAPIYEYTKETRGQKKQRAFFEVELKQLLLDYAQMQSEPQSVETITGRIFMSVSRVLTEFWSYTQSLEIPQNCMLYPYHHFDLQSDQCTTMRLSLIQSVALYDMEQAVLMRRYIGTLAIICQKQSSIPQSLLTKQYGKYWVLQIIIEAITNLSYSFEVLGHFGVLEATAAFLHSLLSHVNQVKEDTYGFQLELLFNLLKQLVFTRPSPWVFRDLSACMLLCTRNNQLMTRMCVNSPSNCFVSDRVRSYYRFGPKSCLLQVYAGLLEVCFCSDLPLQPSHFKLLLALCENHVRFVYQCFTATPEFILKMVLCPSFTDDGKEDNEDMFSKVVGLHSDVTISNTTETFHGSAHNPTNLSKTSSIIVQDKVSQEIQCECYVKLCLSVVTIVYQMMYQWMLQDKKSDILQVGEISQISLHLFTLIFREYYLTCIFRDSEETTKHYLYILCNWWKSQARLLNFENVHLRFLKQLQDLQFMLKPLHQEINHTNLNDDIAEWTRIVSNADKNVPKYVQTSVPLNSETLFPYNTSDFFNGVKRIEYNLE
ncbi:ATR-interacting protein mus304 isoform X1 [Drosophila virilis]|uniref:Uncharacterized protein, isoform A n=1 Tax=Drosophila virilis TaxID=7244 RepID=B4MDA6_DROVI|nr:ATR-interacting protein mus304 isoform X1 [Drosophila virilis]XP_032294738.1 ATR-interacting protein mus304 isoform X1 [Drosophila virilis]XP_032294739.1 ATR-interacting protein mus304 isoform X1 [Drosophila virilis]EDW71167.1 uncharacterized protein Dvir_GJ16213, isoform A [Drosophila virilis]